MKFKRVISRFKSIKYLVFVGFLIIFAIALTNCNNQIVTPIRIGANLWTGYETMYLARDLGYYDNKPIKLVDYPSGTETVRAYRNKEIEGAGLSIDQVIALAATQDNIRIIAIMETRICRYKSPQR
jgi:NitT/TauT family transport system substrate-binding protein